MAKKKPKGFVVKVAEEASSPSSSQPSEEAPPPATSSVGVKLMTSRAPAGPKKSGASLKTGKGVLNEILMEQVSASSSEDGSEAEAADGETQATSESEASDGEQQDAASLPSPPTGPVMGLGVSNGVSGAPTTVGSGPPSSALAEEGTMAIPSTECPPQAHATLQVVLSTESPNRANDTPQVVAPSQALVPPAASSQAPTLNKSKGITGPTSGLQGGDKGHAKSISSGLPRVLLGVQLRSDGVLRPSVFLARAVFL
ncbi:hypothetical protein K2173_005575 [Erythroxylum novogranatense]|uniref:Uncharacterized protein n=1 Tax=Erythroxylum novogranatense TaxID=1862640 RepID=A0AAV8T701_9ROSI|nr:hypothetical protein K2173_005575 [Erythroxylum novogranatense]